jgi:H+/Cl- antiporter ClcA
MTMSLDADGPQPVTPPAVEPDGADDARADTRHVVPRTPPPGWAWWLLRVFLTAQATDAFLQPVLEGRFLSGDFAMLAAHRTNGTYVGVLSLSQILAAVLAWRVSRVPGAIVAAVVALGAATGLQIYLGFNRVLGIHVPLGVAIVGVSGWLAVWMWTHRPGGQPTGKPATSIRARS